VNPRHEVAESDWCCRSALWEKYAPDHDEHHDQKNPEQQRFMRLLHEYPRETRPRVGTNRLRPNVTLIETSMPCRGMRVDESSLHRCEASKRRACLTLLIGISALQIAFDAFCSKSQSASFSLGKDDFSFCKGHVDVLTPLHTNLYTSFT
jgi:hypothetical protein